MRNRWLAFLITMVALTTVLFAHGEWGGAYVERHKTSFFETGAREALISAAAVNYSTVHGRFPANVQTWGRLETDCSITRCRVAQF